jgi:hypothetical protein
MGLFNNIFLLYLCVTIACLFYQPSLVMDGGASSTFLGWFNIDYNMTTNEPNIVNNTFSSGVQSESDRLLSEGRSISGDITGVGGFFLSLIDPVWQVVKFLGLIFSVLFAPLIILSTLSAPAIITFGLGIPFTFLGILSLIMIIRGYS